MEALIGLVIIVYIAGCLLYFGNMAVDSTREGIKVYDIILLTIFLPVTIILGIVLIFALSVEWIHKRVFKSKIGNILNKRVF